MKILSPLFIITIGCLLACQETIDFSAFEGEPVVVLKNPIRFDQLAVGQKNTYISINEKRCGTSFCCEPNLDTLVVEIIAKDTNGYLVKEITNIDTASIIYYLNAYTGFELSGDTLGKEPNIQENTILMVETQPIMDHYFFQESKLFRYLGAKFHFDSLLNSPIEMELRALCELYFLPLRENAPLPQTDHELLQYSELGITRNYSFDGYNYGNLLLATQNYGYQVDNRSFNFGYSLEYGLVFSTFHRVGNFSQVWHLVPE